MKHKNLLRRNKKNPAKQLTNRPPCGIDITYKSKDREK
jgi:hypothetical protein